MKELVECKYCSKPEYYGEMRWLNGKEMCRDCYKIAFEDCYGTHYKWKDLDGERPREVD